MRQLLRNYLPFLALSVLAGCSEDMAPAGSGEDAGEPVIRESAPSLTQSYARFRRSQISGVTYTLSVRVDDEADLFTGQVTIGFRVDAGNVSPITVDFDSGEILELNVNGMPGRYQYDRWFITLPPEQFAPNSRNTVTIRYRRPYADDGAGLHRFEDPRTGEVYLYTDFEPYDANRLFPHFDQPDLKARLTMSVNAPAEWEVIANTRELDTRETEERREWFFPATERLPSYVYALHAGPFTVWEDTSGNVPMRLLARTSLADYVEPEEWFHYTHQSLDFFREYFDTPYPFGKYDQVIVPDFNAGAMENVGAVTFNERYIVRGEKSTAERMSLANTIAHEMAHMWFGNLVTMEWWNDLWLNESFATYMANLVLEAGGEFENVWDNFFSGTKQWAYETDQLVTTHPIEVAVPNTAEAFTNFDGITYGKGASVLRQLPYFLGEDNFRQGVNRYLQEHAFDNSTIDDFVNALADASGRDLTQWQREWLLRSGVNTLEARFECQGDRLASLRLIQYIPAVAAADKVLRSQRVQVGLYRLQDDGTMERYAALPVTYRGTLTHVDGTAGRRCPHLVFPNEGDWGYVKINLDDTSRAAVLEHINDIPSSTTRIMLWRSLWDRVQRADMPVTAFIDFTLDSLETENDLNIIRQVSDDLASAMDFLARADTRLEYRERAESFMREQLAQAGAGSDLQKTWLDQLVGHAFTESGLDYLRALLTGEAELEGFELDQDRRWEIVITLNRHLHGNFDAILTNERRRDDSNRGITKALAAEAVRPEPAVKAAWLDTAINSPESHRLATLRTVLGYLFPPEQTGLLERHAEQLLEAIPRVNETGDQGYINAFVDTLIPSTCTRESVERLAEAMEDFSGYHPLIRKGYRVAHQLDQRCLSMAEVL